MSRTSRTRYVVIGMAEDGLTNPVVVGPYTKVERAATAAATLKRKGWDTKVVLLDALTDIGRGR